MEDNLKDKINKFNSNEDLENELNNDTVIVKSTNDGLFERVDKTLLVKDGRQLLN